MREVKFKVWDGKKLSKTFDLSQHPMYWECLEDGERLLYTGLKDRNGIELYEGDILGKEGHFSFFIKFSDGAFRRVPINPIQRINWEHYPLNHYWLLDNQLSYIGNIYENPELLEDIT